MLKWYAFDSDFMPKKLDSRLKFWTFNGITTLSKLIKDGKVISFDTQTKICTGKTRLLSVTTNTWVYRNKSRYSVREQHGFTEIV